MHSLLHLDASSPVQLDAHTVEVLTTVHGWGRAFEERDLRGLLALSTPDIRLGDGDRAADGHEGVKRMLLLQSYGVAQHARPVRYLVHGSIAVVQATLELRWVDGGELAETRDGVALFETKDMRVSRFCPRPDLVSAFRAAGWPVAALP